MRPAELRRRRLARQHLAGRGLATPAEVVRWLGAVQAQDLRGALWGIGQRTAGASEADLEQAIAGGALVRSWPMRRTLHLVAAGDLRWMLRHLASRALRGMAGRLRQLGLDAAELARAGRQLERALAGGRQLTRAEIYQRLARGGVATDEQRGIHIIASLAMEGLLCFGPLRGKQPTFVLLDEWVPPADVPGRDEALAALARRYLESHGPATAADLAWWAGLSLGEARAAIEAARPHVVLGRDGYADAAAPPARARPAARLLPPWDEYTVAYRDRSAILEPAAAEVARGGIVAPVVVLDGRVAGTWRRRRTRREVEIAAELIAPPGAAHRRALAAAAARLGAFHGLPAALTVTARPARPARSRRRPRRA